MMNRLTVLITNQSLWFRSGTETYVRDLAIGLLESGHTPVVFSPQLGELAEEILQAGIPVVNDLKTIGSTPDVIHGHHSLEIMSAILSFPETPAVFACHDSSAWHDTPPPLPQIRRYIAVGEATRDRLMMTHAVSPEEIRIVPNAVDLSRFRPQRELPAKPQRALVFSNYMQSRQLTEIRRACAARRISLDAVGERQGNKTSTPETLLPAYDLVFAKGRSALEAMSCGASVIVCDARGCGPLVTSTEFHNLRRVNFGRRLLQEPLHADFIGHQIDRYDAPDAAKVISQVRTECGVDSLIKQVLDVYRDAITERRSVSDGEMLAATSQSITWWANNWSRLLQETQARHADELQQLLEAARRRRFLPRMLRSIRERQRSLANSVFTFMQSSKKPGHEPSAEERKAA